MQEHAHTTPGPIQFDVWALVTILRRRLWVVVLAAFVLAGLTAAYTLVVSPVYRATARILVDPATRQPFDNPNLSSRRNDETAFIDSQVAVIGSDTVLRPVVRKNNLMSDDEFGDGALSGLLTSIVKRLLGGGDSGPATEARRENNAIENLGKALTVKREGLTYVISVSVDSENPAKAAKVAQDIAESYLTDGKRHKETSSIEVMEQIDNRLVGLRQQLHDAESAVQKFKAENQLQSTGDSGLLTSQELAGLNTQLTEARAELAEKQARYNEIAAALKKGVSRNSINEIPLPDTANQLRNQYVLAVRQEANLEADLLPMHPNLLRAKREVNRIEALLRAEAQNVANAAKIELAVARERVVNLERALDTSRSESNTGDAALIRLRELETEATTTRTLYESVLGKAKEIAELDQVTIPGARIIGPAVPPKKPVWPKKKLLVALAGVLGLLLGTALVVGGEAIRQLTAHMQPPLERDRATMRTGRIVADTAAEKEAARRRAKQYILANSSKPQAKPANASLLDSLENRSLLDMRRSG